MRRGGPRRGEELALQNLGDEAIRHGSQIGIVGLARGLHVHTTLPRRRPAGPGYSHRNPPMTQPREAAMPLAMPQRPTLMSTRAMVVSEHYLSAEAGMRQLQAGGNAFDAAVAATLVEGVVNPHMHT